MSNIDDALARVNAAMEKLETAFEAKAASDAKAVSAAPAGGGETKLKKEIQVLRARAEEDARLRAEAAGAVREALRDLRGAVGNGAQAGG